MLSSESLKHLIEIFRVVSKTLPSRTQHLTRATLKSKDSDGRFYRALAAGEPFSEDDLAVLATGGTLDRRTAAYKMQRSTFKEHLLNTLFFLDLKAGGYSEVTRRSYKIDREAFVARVLYHLGAKSIGASTAGRVFEESKEHEMWDVALSALSLLRSHAAWVGNASRHASLVQEGAHLLSIYSAEFRAKSDYEDLMLSFVNTGSERTDLLEKALRYANSVKQDETQYNTFGLALSSYRIQSGLLQLQMNYQASLELADGFAARLTTEHKKFFSPGLMTELALKQLLCALQLKDAGRGQAAAKECERLLTPQSNNWYVYKEYEFLLLMQTEQFKSAYSLLQTVTASDRFSDLPEHRLQRWELFAQYNLYALGHTKHPEAHTHIAQRISKYSKDKSGFYASMLVLEILILIDQGNFSALISRDDALKMYRSRYLKHAQSVALDLFFQLLHVLERANFDPDEAERQGAELAVMLSRANQDVLSGIQILPYDWLWRHVISGLRVTKHNRRPTS